MVMLFLVFFPIFTRLRHAAFEARRWAESDHAPAASSDSSDGGRLMFDKFNLATGILALLLFA